MRNRCQPIPPTVAGQPHNHGHENVATCPGWVRCSPNGRALKRGTWCSWSITSPAAIASGTIWASTATALPPIGSTTPMPSDMAIPPSIHLPLSGGLQPLLYLAPNAIIHKVPDGATPVEAGTATPMANGVQWALFEGGVGYASVVLIQGPGQQGLSCVMASKHAGADRIIVTGTSKDARRLEVAKAMGADDVIDVENEDPLERILEITGGLGVDVSVDCTVGAGTAPTLLGIEAAKRRGAVLVVQGEDSEFPSFPIGRMTRKYITLKSARGHSYRAVELALHQIASHRFPLELMTTHSFGLEELDYAIKSVAGEGAPGAIHVSMMPWGKLNPGLRSLLHQASRRSRSSSITKFGAARVLPPGE